MSSWGEELPDTDSTVKEILVSCLSLGDLARKEKCHSHHVRQHCSGCACDPSSHKVKASRKHHQVTLKDIQTMREKEKELSEALESQDKLNLLVQELDHVDRGIKILESKGTSDESTVQTSSLGFEVKTKAKREEDERLKQLRRKKGQLEIVLASLKHDPKYRSERQINHLSEKLSKIQCFVNAALEVNANADKSSRSCPVCFEANSSQVFSCLKCENWICGPCKDKIEACPSCRESFKANPPRRNRTAERILAA